MSKPAYHPGSQSRATVWGRSFGAIATLLGFVAMAQPAMAGEAGRRVGDEDETIAAVSKDGNTIALRKADRVRVVDLRQGRVGASRVVPQARLLLLADQAGPMVIVDLAAGSAERLDAFVDRPARQTLRIPAHVVAATIDAGAGALVVVTDEAAPATTGGRGPVRLGRRACVHRLPFVGGDPVRYCTTLPTSAKTPTTQPQLLQPQLVHGHADASIWWLSPRCTTASAQQAAKGGAAAAAPKAPPSDAAAADTCLPGSRALVISRLDATTLQPLGVIDTGGNNAPRLPRCAEAAIPGPMRVDVDDESVSFLSQRADGPASAALWTILPRVSGLAVGFHCLPGDRDGSRADAVGNPVRALLGVGRSAVALDVAGEGSQTAIAASRGEGAPVWQVAADGAHAAMQQGRLLVAIDRNDVIGVATSRGILATCPSRLVWRDWERSIRSATWEEMAAVPAPPAGLDAVVSWIDVAVQLLASLR